jgi:DNA-binding LytR/AlgR family response regulator
MIKAIAVDDEPPALEILENYCARTPQVQLIKTFTSTFRALEYLDNFPVDLVFLDINMPSLNGIEFSKRIPRGSMVIFTTSYTEYAVESYNLNAVDYLLKPYTYSRFQQAVEKARTAWRHQQTDGEERYLILRVDYSLVRVALPGILFIEGLDNYLKVHLRNQSPIVVRMTMKALQEKLPGGEFVRVHRSFIVSISKVDSVRNKILFVGEEEIPLGSSHEKNFYSIFNAFKA